jgi:hypothetical protein
MNDAIISQHPKGQGKEKIRTKICMHACIYDANSTITPMTNCSFHINHTTDSIFRNNKEIISAKRPSKPTTTKHY